MICDLHSYRNVIVYSYADGITFAIKETSVAEIKREIRIYLKILEKWLEKWSVKINQGKTVLQVFTRKRGYHIPILRMNVQMIKVVSSHKLLAVQLIWMHQNYHGISILTSWHMTVPRRLVMMKSLTSTTWEALGKMLQMLYAFYSRLKLE